MFVAGYEDDPCCNELSATLHTVTLKRLTHAEVVRWESLPRCTARLGSFLFTTIYL